MKTVQVLTHRNVIAEDNIDVKLIGIYSDVNAAGKAIQRLSAMPGFSRTVDGFIVKPYHLNEVHWSEGFSSDDAELS